MAFYNHRLLDFLTALGISSLFPNLALPMRSWDVRSMTKAVLRARWCTCGWTLNLLIFVRRGQLHRVGRCIPHEKRQRFLEIIAKKIPKSDDSLPNCQWDGPADIFDLVGGAPEQDEHYLRPLSQELDGSASKAMFMQCVPIRVASKYASTNFAECLRGDPLRMFIEAFLREEGVRWNARGDFHPEDHPFKISPSAFQQAAILDTDDYNEEPEHILHYQIPRVLLLFELDPLSTPHRDPVLLPWGALMQEFLRCFLELQEDAEDRLEALDTRMERCADDEFPVLLPKYENLNFGLRRAEAMNSVFKAFENYVLYGSIDILPDYNGLSIYLMKSARQIHKSRSLDCGTPENPH
ncbi:hypothetical protein EDD37DRAFT_653578 [Exophiala viscosa]|uniref:Uncharacterized protein n=1 Tax=Exophiala viscosa TaxID=2486360 RepID=A0AAN6DQ56_9EURO|nr:hypothetical protein EDD36DRAFT_468396 [Exophiala viscosa]KAI1620514.1 hypothetical protein EDD37DRAFT_653578 [Exophiala viscosa]